jgi:hypothetical protein
MVLASMPMTALPNDLTNMSQMEIKKNREAKKGYAYKTAYH